MGCVTLFLQHGNDVLCGAITEQLAKGLLVVGDVVRFNESDELFGGVAREGGLGEVRVFGEEVFRAGMEVGEITATSARDEDLFAGAIGVIEQDDASAAAAGLDRAHETCCAGPDDHNLYFLCVQCCPLLSPSFWCSAQDNDGWRCSTMGR